LASVSEEERAGGGKSRMLFPLRTGVELFSDPSMPAAVSRAKQAAVLYDEVVFETGLYEVSIAETGSSGWWHPPGGLTDEDLEASRRLQTPGTPFTISLAADGSDRAATFVDSPLVAAYASEYHTGILDELARFSPDWVKLLTLANNPPASTPEGKLFRRMARRDKRNETLMPNSRRGGDRFKRNWIIENFNRDLVVSSLVGSAFNPTSLFAPMVSRHTHGPPPGLATDGRTALSVAAPNVGALPWEAVAEFRDHAGSGEVRVMLREFDKRAAREEPEDALAYFGSVSRDVAGALTAVANAQRRGWGERIAAAVLGTAVELEPHVGPIAGPALTATGLGRQWLQERRSWTAAFMLLTRGES